MSTRTDRSQDPQDLSFYAPKGRRSIRLAEVSEAAAALIPTSGPEDAGKDGVFLRSPSAEPFEHPAIQRLRARQSLDPELVPQPPSGSEKSALARVGRVCAVLFLAALVALVVTGWPHRMILVQEAKDRTIELIALLTHKAAPSSTVAEFPRIVVQHWRGTSGEPAPLGVTVQGKASGAVLVVTGLTPGMTLSMGSPLGANAWQVPATSEVLQNTWITAPQGFVGVMDLRAELHLSDTTIAHRRPIHLEWGRGSAAIAEAASISPASSAVMPARQETPAQAQLDREEVTMLVQRGKDFIATGDLVAARVLLQRAAESDDAEAALALAATYDPLVLRELKVYGITADLELARTWYERAKHRGSAEAPRRLNALAAMH